MKGRLLLVILSICLICPVDAQVVLSETHSEGMTFNADYLKRKTARGKESLLNLSLAPALMLGVGSIYTDYILADRIHYAGEIGVPAKVSDVSDIVQYAPAGILLATCLTLKLSGRQDWNDMKRVLFTGAAGAVTEAAIVNALKYTVRRPRPGYTQDNSFPSGHSTTAFLAATILHKEYGESISPWFSVAGYGIAAGTGIARVVADKHWISDVLAGAGIGIFSGEFAYWLNDALFGKGKMASTPVCWPESGDWSFALYSQYNFERIADYDNSRPEQLIPGYSIGVQADRMLTDMIGVTLSGDLSRMRWIGDNDVILPDMGALPLLGSVHAGLTGKFPLYRSLGSFAELKAGACLGEDYNLNDMSGNIISVSYPTSFSARARAGLSVRTSCCSVVSCFAGLEHLGGYGLMFSAGTSFNLTF